MLKLCPSGHVTGLDMSELALEESKDLNYHAYVDKLCSIVGGNATQLPLARDMFDVVSAFETIYYWSSLAMGASEIFRVLKPGGTCIIANEMDGLDPGAHALERAISIRIYTIDEIIADLTEIGFTDIQARHDEQRHFVCVTARKPI
jgi:ubiquinone/menaquinone biosynthesis C-methylase UbiE